MRAPDAQPGTGALQATLRGFFLSAAGMDGGFFLIMAAMPFKVLALGGDALALGLVPAIGAVTYIVSAPLSGHWSDRVSRTLLCLAGGSVLIICAVLAWLVQRLDLLLALQVLMGLGKALYWPTVQATLGDLSPGTRRLPVLGRFNVAWSTGKTLGFALGGLLLACCGFRTAYLVGAASVAAAFVALPKSRLVNAGLAAVQTTGPSPAADQCHDTTTLRSFRAMGWIANTAAYGAFGILSAHLPQWFAHHGWAASHYGWYQGAILACQTAFFLLLTGPLKLAYSAWRLWLPQAFSVVAVLLVPWLPGFGLLLLTAPLIGLGCGVCYTASIFYSLEIPGQRGRNAGIHEGLVGAGGFLPPVIAGLLVRAGLGLAAPYWLASGLLMLALLAQIVLHARSARPA